MRIIKKEIIAKIPFCGEKSKLEKQGSRHTIVGFSASAIDITLLNIIAALFGLPGFVANLLSVTLASVFSYILNRRWVFPTDMRKRDTVVSYALVTLVAIYVIQTAVIITITTYGESIGQFLATALEPLTGGSIASETLLLNIAKIAAVIVAGVWNFIMYRRVVFKAHR